jgi:hypothetical protein
MLYKRRPIIVDAMQYEEGGPLPEGCMRGGAQLNSRSDQVWLLTRDGPSEIKDGDWIVTDKRNGRRQVMADGAFKFNYDRFSLKKNAIMEWEPK